MKNAFRIWCCTVFLFTFSTIAASDHSFSKITYSDQKAADKVLISLHHAILEVNREEKYMIATLSAQEKALLQKNSFHISTADQWAATFKQKFSQQTSQSNTSAFTTTIDGFECYATVEETYQQAQALADRFPQLATWNDIGDSWLKTNGQGGYDLMVLKITNRDISKTKPILFVHSSMHAREYAPAALNLDFAKWLLNNYATNADAKFILDNREVHLLLHMNPDGRKIAENRVLQRKNTNQNHCAGSTVGVDLNRNFAQTWAVTPNGSSGNECSEVYRGVSGESEPETQAMSNYVRSLYIDERGENDSDAAPQNKSGLHIDLHSYGKLILWPYGHKQIPSPNNTGFVHLGNKMAWFNNYTPQQSIGLYATDGTSDNVSYGELGVAALTFELGSSFFQSCNEYHNRIKPDNLNALIYAAKVSEAPYLLSRGTDISSITLNGNENEVTVVPASLIDLVISSTLTQTTLSGGEDTVASFEYVIDSDFADPDKIIQLQDLTVDANGVISANVQLNTADFSYGQHVISVRAKNSDNFYGVVSSALINVSDNSAPIPRFNTTCEYLICTFNASDSSDDGNIVSYQWGLLQENGDISVIGSSETLRYNFSAAGEVTVQLLVEDDNQLQASIEQTFSVEAEAINVAPVASFTANCDKLTCTFNGVESTDSDGEIVQYQWFRVNSDNSEDALGQGQELTQTFSASGTLTVKLTVVDNNEAQASVSKTLTLEDPEEITVVVEKSKSSGAWSFYLYYLVLILLMFRLPNRRH